MHVLIRAIASKTASEVVSAS